MASTKYVAGSGYHDKYVDSLIWGGDVWDTTSGPIRYFFATYLDMSAAAEHHNGPLVLDVEDPRATWTYKEKQAFQSVLKLYASVCNVTFQEADSIVDESTDLVPNMVWWQVGEGDYYGVHETPSSQSWGFFNYRQVAAWGTFEIGSRGRKTIIHEIGHGLGLAHPHDGGVRPDATTFPEVTSDEDLGTGGLNQTIWTVMSYNEGYDPKTVTDLYGNQGGLGALDIAALQKLYGANMDTRTGDDVYRLPSGNRKGTGWWCTWDAGGSDTVSASGAKAGADIDLRAATLRDGKGTAGFVSAVRKVSGGFTIAHGVVIENAIGSKQADRITGNSHANVLDGRGGADRMDGLGGDDTYYVDNRGDLVTDTGGGRDSILARTSYTMLSDAGVEFLQAADLGGRSALKLTGNASSNVITGNAGSNVLDGGSGRDTLTGGLGRDQFLFATTPGKGNSDRIVDFTVADDTIRLDRVVFKTLKKAGWLSESAFFVASAGNKAHDASDRIIYDEMSGSLLYDPDGSGRTKAVVFAVIETGLALTAHDFFVV